MNAIGLARPPWCAPPPSQRARATQRKMVTFITLQFIHLICFENHGKFTLGCFGYFTLVSIFMSTKYNIIILANNLTPITILQSISIPISDISNPILRVFCLHQFFLRHSSPSDPRRPRQTVLFSPRSRTGHGIASSSLWSPPPPRGGARRAPLCPNRRAARSACGEAGFGSGRRPDVHRAGSIPCRGHGVFPIEREAAPVLSRPASMGSRAGLIPGTFNLARV